MKNINAEIEIPEDAYLTLASSGYSKKLISSEAKRLLAIDLYKKSILSLGKATELSGQNMSQFIETLGTAGVPVVDYDEEELTAEYNLSKKLG